MPNQAAPVSTGPKNALIYQVPNSGFDDAMIKSTIEMLQNGGWNVESISSNIAGKLQSNDISLFVCPGSNRGYDSFYNTLSQADRSAISRFVRDDGNSYLGICMGAAIAGRYSLNLLHGDVQPQGTRSSNAQIEDISFNGSTRGIFTEDAPNLGVHQSKPGKQRVVSKYLSDGSANAIVLKSGKGAVGLISGHPEANEYWLNGMDSQKDVCPELGIAVADLLYTRNF